MSSQSKLDMKNLTPDQKQIFEKFRDLASTKDPKEKQKAFLNFIGFLKKQKTGIDPKSVVRQNELGIADSLLGEKNV